MDLVFIYQTILTLLSGLPLLFKILLPSLSIGFAMALGLALFKALAK